MKLFIPPLGTVLKLTSEWAFNYYDEYRNTGLREYLGLPRPSYYEPNKLTRCELPIDALLKIDRIYIKKGSPAYDSITFLWLKESIPVINKKKITKSIRFWVKLIDANEIEYKIHEE
jgi:hypothetical protein